MNKSDRVRQLLPDLAEHDLTALTDRPTADLNLILRVIRQAKRTAVAEHTARAAQRRQDRRKHRHHDEHELAKRNTRLLAATGARAATGNLDALVSLTQARQAIDAQLTRAVPELRLRGLSDADIAAYIGVTRQYIGQKYGRRAESHTDGLGTSDGPATPAPASAPVQRKQMFTDLSGPHGPLDRALFTATENNRNSHGKTNAGPLDRMDRVA